MLVGKLPRDNWVSGTLGNFCDHDLPQPCFALSCLQKKLQKASLA